jgi:hypothetical protein
MSHRGKRCKSSKYRKKHSENGTKPEKWLPLTAKQKLLFKMQLAFLETQKRLEQAEKEVRKLKLEALQRDINLGAEQLRNGQYTEYDDESLPGLLQKIKERGESRLHSQKD